MLIALITTLIICNMKTTFDFLNKYKSLLIIGVLVIIILLQRSCGGTGKPCPEVVKTDTITIIKHDTVVDTIYIDKPKPYETIVTDTIIKYDSAKCQLTYRLYYSKNIYRDILKDDSTALIILEDTVWKNELQHRKLYYTNRTPQITQIITKTIEQPLRNKVFVGATLGGWSDKITAGGSVMLTTKLDHGYSATFDPFYKCVYGTVYWKLRLSKK